MAPPDKALVKLWLAVGAPLSVAIERAQQHRRPRDAPAPSPRPSPTPKPDTVH